MEWRRRSAAWLGPLIGGLVPLALAIAGGRRPAQEAPPLVRPEPQSEDREAAGDDEEDVTREPLPSLPAASRIGVEVAPRNAPFLIARADGRVLLGCVEWTPGAGDRIELRELLGAPSAAAASDLPARHVSKTPAEIIRPVGVVDASGRLNVFWTQLEQGRAQIAWAREEAAGFTAPVFLTSGPLPNMNPETVLHADGRIFVAWEADVAPAAGVRSNRDVLVAPLLEGGKLGAAVRVGDGRFSDLDAVIASHGRLLWTAWARFCGADYEIMLRSLDPANGKLGEPIAVSDDAFADDLHPSLAAAKDGDLWIAWDRIQITKRGNSAPRELRADNVAGGVELGVRCACVRKGRVRIAGQADSEVQDGTVPGAPRMSAGGGLPRLAFDARGRLWIAYRYLSHPGDRESTTFPILLQSLASQGWSAPVEVAESGGVNEEPALARFGDGVLAAYFCDRRGYSDGTGAPPEPMRAALSAQGVQIGCWWGASSIGLATSPPDPREPGVATLVERNPAVIRRRRKLVGLDPDDPILSGASHHEIRRGDDRWMVLWGDLHRHSSISRCSEGKEPTPADRWASGRDVALCDFMALTDHCNHAEPFAWWQLDKLVWLYDTDRFCTLSGFEWSTRAFGHHNVILSGRLTPVVQPDCTLEQLYRGLPVDQAITIPHHTAHPTFPVPFEKCEDGHSRLIEIYQAMRGNYEFDGCFKQAATATVPGSFVRDALAQGHEFGFIASTDHSSGQSYACVLAGELDRASIFEALRARRTYGATAKGILVDFRVGDAVMGEKIALTEDPRVHLSLRGTDELAEVSVIKDGGVFQRVGHRAAAPNGFSPMRLVVTLDPSAPPAAHAWTLVIRSPKARFGTLDERRRSAPDAATDPAPVWTGAGKTATFTCPAGYAARPGANEFTVHWFAAADVKLEATLANVHVERSCSELAKQPIELSAPGLGTITLALAIDDAGIDLVQGLGTREFTAEWLDADSEPGPSWYYARVVQVDGEMAWSSPIFVHRK